ncbi:MAG TPA: homoserine O-acetyltransferase [bacterium]|nr:homoserine O-acetyltransferase [bacterium]HPR86601.1 homoserine O-acetyltransferase [bacterium]
MEIPADSVGVVERQYFTFAAPPREMALDNGGRLGPITLAYEIYGMLNAARDNAILLLHALSGDAHVAGWHHPADHRPGWWDFMVGHGRPFDIDKYCVICSNVIGGCQGSTGPSSIDPASGRPYALGFPVVTIADMVRAQMHLIDHLGIERLLCVAGGSMGGMQALQWCIAAPQRVAAAIPIATTCHQNAMQIGWDEVGRQAIYADADWCGGDYQLQGKIPARGLATARMLAHITYLSEESMRRKFGRTLREKEDYGFDFRIDFEVESYLRHQGEIFVARFDANSYLYITKAIDYFDLARDYGSLDQAFQEVTARFLVLSFTSDWLYPTSQSLELLHVLEKHKKAVTFREFNTWYGHDSFLLPNPEMMQTISRFLAEVYASRLPR